MLPFVIYIYIYIYILYNIYTHTTIAYLQFLYACALVIHHQLAEFVNKSLAFLFRKIVVDVLHNYLVIANKFYFIFDQIFVEHV